MEFSVKGKQKNYKYFDKVQVISSKKSMGIDEFMCFGSSLRK